jgi:phage FluMu protein Com
MKGKGAEVEVKCPNCGAVNWLENQSRCLKCDSVLRRCADCAHYDAPSERCSSLSTDIDGYEAEHPSLLSISTNCPGYRCAGTRT